ncbi:MAG: enoyl-CoA hydratase/isomerase family protein [Halioglobus sp.]|nr:enoyl-CoA hydratase/isomerase family protein [Halioglobus sp.]
MSVLKHDCLGKCAILTLNRPDSLNAINTDMLDHFDTYLDTIEKDSSRALIITGTGRGFCPGTDLKQPPDDPTARIQRAHALIRRLIEFPKLSVAAINGLALGGGLELALGCTFRIAAREATLGLPEIKIGLMPAYGGTVLLPRIVGEQRALDMMLSGDAINAETALEIGLVSSLCDHPDEAIQHAHDFAQRFIRHSLIPQQAIRQAIHKGSELPLTAALAHESHIMDAVAASEDCAEGVMSFIQRRKPVWKDC